MTGIAKITKRNDDGSVEIKELNAYEVVELLAKLQKLERDLIAAYEERDRYKADSEVLNALIKPENLEIGRKEIEDRLIEFRDQRISEIRGNGLVIKEKDGTESNVIRFGPETALYIGIQAIRKRLEGK